MVVLIEVAGWLLFAGAIAGILLNFALSRRNPDHRPHAATRQLVLGCMIAGGVLLATAYTLGALDLADTLMDSGRRGGSLWVPVVIFGLLAISGVRAWRRGGADS